MTKNFEPGKHAVMSLKAAAASIKGNGQMGHAQMLTSSCPASFCECNWREPLEMRTPIMSSSKQVFCSKISGSIMYSGYSIQHKQGLRSHRKYVLTMQSLSCFERLHISCAIRSLQSKLPIEDCFIAATWAASGNRGSCFA